MSKIFFSFDGIIGFIFFSPNHSLLLESKVAILLLLESKEAILLKQNYYISNYSQKSFELIFFMII